MCSFTGQKEIDAFIHQNRDKEEIDVWKIYRVTENGLQPHNHPTDGQYITPGDIVSNRTTRLLEDEGDRLSCASNYYIVKRGIHVFTTRKLAELWISRWRRESKNPVLFDRRHVIIRCTAKMEDLVAVEKLIPTTKYTKIRDPELAVLMEEWMKDKDLAVFMKVHISQKDYDEATEMFIFSPQKNDIEWL